jgi:hypothetical protein
VALQPKFGLGTLHFSGFQITHNSRTGGAEKKGKTQEAMEKRGRKGSSCARSEEMERSGYR